MENLTETSGIATNLDLFRQALDNNAKFTVAVLGGMMLKDGVRDVTIHLKDTSQHILLIITLMTARRQFNVPGCGKSEDVVQMKNTSGQMVLTARGMSGSFMICSGAEGSFLGRLNVIHLIATDATGEILFRCKRDSGGSQISLISNVVKLASIRRVHSGPVGAEIDLFDSRNMDLSTKAILIFAAYYLYVSDFAETSYGRTGFNGFFKRSLFLACILFFIPATVGAVVFLYFF